jgi:uncharacterized membrane-anchored protein YhcB (DUF1043 family)
VRGDPQTLQELAFAGSSLVVGVVIGVVVARRRSEDSPRRHGDTEVD